MADARLLALEAERFAPGELAGGDAGVDARLLVRLAVVDAMRERCAALRERADRSDREGERRWRKS